MRTAGSDKLMSLPDDVAVMRGGEAGLESSTGEGIHLISGSVSVGEARVVSEDAIREEE